MHAVESRIFFLCFHVFSTACEAQKKYTYTAYAEASSDVLCFPNAFTYVSVLTVLVLSGMIPYTLGTPARYMC